MICVLHFIQGVHPQVAEQVEREHNSQHQQIVEDSNWKVNSPTQKKGGREVKRESERYIGMKGGMEEGREVREVGQEGKSSA